MLLRRRSHAPRLRNRLAGSWKSEVRLQIDTARIRVRSKSNWGVNPFGAQPPTSGITILRCKSQIQYKSRAKFGGMQANEATRLRDIEGERQALEIAG